MSDPITYSFQGLGATIREELSRIPAPRKHIYFYTCLLLLAVSGWSIQQRVRLDRDSEQLVLSAQGAPNLIAERLQQRNEVLEQLRP